MPDFGIGDFGPGARRFCNWLASAGQRWWQVLPLSPTDPFYTNSPYRSSSGFALSPLYVSPELLIKQNLLARADLRRLPGFRAGRVDYHRVAARKMRLLDRAWQRFRRRPTADFRQFCAEHRSWLDDYALFVVLKQKFKGLAWTDWPKKLRGRDRASLREVAGVFQPDLDRVRFQQYLAFSQWLALRHYCNRKGIGIIGDLPFYVDSDSSDVWANQRLFRLDRQGRPRFVAGVPPDCFSSTGQLWGNPVYDWPAHRRTGFWWWIQRVEHQLRLFDIVRIDHFRGLVAYWRVPAGERTAVSGRWVRAPGSSLLAALQSRFPNLPFIAENLGYITPAVERVRRRFGLPGMKVLLFAFGEPESPHLPENVTSDTVYYTGTHDNNTVRGWFEKEAGEAGKKRGDRLLGHKARAGGISRDFIRLCLESRAATVIVPVQDILGLGAEARINTPGTTLRTPNAELRTSNFGLRTSHGNWQWRLAPGQLTAGHARALRRLTKSAGRSLT